jgi:hypothetical protein
MRVVKAKTREAATLSSGRRSLTRAFAQTEDAMREA